MISVPSQSVGQAKGSTAAPVPAKARTTRLMIQWQLHNNNDDDDNSANAHPAHSVRTEQIVGVWVDHVSFELHLAGDAAVCGVRDVSRFLTDRPNKSQEISTGGRIDLLYSRLSTR